MLKKQTATEEGRAFENRMYEEECAGREPGVRDEKNKGGWRC